MSESDRKTIVITKEDLRDPKIDEIIETERSYGRRVTEPVVEKPGRFNVFYASWFYLMLAGSVAAFAAWAIIEPFFDDGMTFTGRIETVEPGASPEGFYVKDATIWGRMRIAGIEVYLTNELTNLADQQGKLLPPSSFGLLQPGQIARVNGQVAPDSTSFLAMVVWHEPDTVRVADSVNLSTLAVQQTFVGFALFPLVAALVGLMVGSVEGAICRTFSRAAWCGGVGLVTGLVGGAISIVIGGLVFTLIGKLGPESGNPFESKGAFMLLVFRRGLGWTLAGMAMGLGQGLALKSRKLIVNGLIGGLVGGLIGGLLFDPIYLLFAGRAMLRGGEISRAIGLTIIGGTVGLMIGLTEMLTRDAWLKVIQGPLRGKEFSFNRTPIRLGSSPKNEIYLFKDAKIDPIHAEIDKLRDTYEIVDSGSATGTFVNGQRVKSHRLMDGDVIKIGDSEFSYSMREKKARPQTIDQTRLSQAS